MLKIRYTMADHVANNGSGEFVNLGETDLGPKYLVERFFHALPLVQHNPTADREFLVDLMAENGDRIDEAYISPETVAEHIDAPLDAAIERGKQHTRQIIAAWAKARA